MRKKILSVFGTRPEAIKMAPLVKVLSQSTEIESVVCVTAQHREMLDQVLSIFDIQPTYDLNIMRKDQTLSSISSDVLQGVDHVIKGLAPDMVLVHGDTTTAFASALAAFYKQIPVGHVEAGLRTYNMHSPFPEEMNRSLISRIAKLHFAPTYDNAMALRRERVQGKIIVTGNTVIDALRYTVRDDYKFNNEALKNLDLEGARTLLLTAHRRENIGSALRNICAAVKEITSEVKDVQVVCPMHPNPVVHTAIINALGKTGRVHLVEPLDVCDMHNLMARCHLILTDSGGLQEEAPALGKPVVVLRDTTERNEAIEAGTVVMGGTRKDSIVRKTLRLLNDESCYQQMARSINPYGDGHASEHIAESLRAYFGEFEQEEKQYV